jgi:hypothetical protein
MENSSTESEPIYTFNTPYIHKKTVLAFFYALFVLTAISAYYRTGFASDFLGTMLLFYSALCAIIFAWYLSKEKFRLEFREQFLRVI